MHARQCLVFTLEATLNRALVAVTTRGAARGPQIEAADRVSTLSDSLVRPHIIKDRTARAWLRAHSGRAEFAPLLDSCSQPSAKFVILLPETSHSVYAAFFKDNSIPHDAAPPTIHDTVTRSFEPSTRGRARCVTLNV